MLKYIKFSYRNAQSRKYNLYQCSCGVEKIIREDLVKSNQQKSCGCSRKTMNSFSTHGMSRSRPYLSWGALKQRCNNGNNKGYKNYGGRGIKVCKRWEKFENFWEDMKDSYSDDLMIDRIDNNGNYSKKNCRWTTSEVQNSNKRNNKRYFDGKEYLTLKQLSKKYNIKYTTLSMRINGYKWDIYKAIR